MPLFRPLVPVGARGLRRLPSSGVFGGMTIIVNSDFVLFRENRKTNGVMNRDMFCRDSRQKSLESCRCRSLRVAHTSGVLLKRALSRSLLPHETAERRCANLSVGFLALSSNGACLGAFACRC